MSGEIDKKVDIIYKVIDHAVNESFQYAKRESERFGELHKETRNPKYFNEMVRFMGWGEAMKDFPDKLKKAFEERKKWKDDE